MNKKVLLAISGGVDSTVSALILKNEGYEVQGIFLDFFNDKKKVDDAKLAAKSVDVPLKIINASNEFKKTVINYFLSELRKGNTPNPCVVCNKEIKFKILLDQMRFFKAGNIATGHYAKIMKYETNDKKYKFSLFEATDKTKDQSYFLYKLSQKELSRIIFPLGNYKKKDIRKIAKKYRLPLHDKQESQDVCFIPNKGYNFFLSQMLKLKKGKIYSTGGRLMGMHDGLPLYTIGQRKGIKLGGNGPFYVISKDSKTNRLIVSNSNDDLGLYRDKIFLKNVNWIIKKPKLPAKILIRTRYRSLLICGIIKKVNIISLEKTQRAITPGQSAIFYSKRGEVLGGGTII